MKILILNWRDIKNPSSGGAEIFTHELSKGLIKKGHSVTIFSSSFEGAKNEEIIDSIRVIREGHPDARTLFNSVHFKAYKRYKKEFEGKVDLVIDEVHGVPFFSTFYVKEKKAALICEMAGDLWNIAVSFPFSILGKIVEKIYPLFYKKVPVITISESSKLDLTNNGFSKEKVFVISMGSNSNIVLSLPEKERNETLVFLSRLSRTKGVSDAIEAVSLLNKEFPDIMLWIVGRGEKEYIEELKNLVKKLKIEKHIKFFDYVSEDKKQDLLTRAHILIAPSFKEGWGLTVHEAGARGTPAVVYNVPGLREVVVNNINGLICEVNSPENLAINIKKLLTDAKLYKKLQAGSITQRKKHTWDKSAEEFLKFVNK